MHIPDGYLGPTTYLTCYALVAPFWAGAWRALRRKLQTMEVPYLALGAAFIFVVMMFNVPIPGGTTGHVVGASIVAISFGGWAAVLAVSFALLIQALIFGDGGVTALGANCLNMAVVQTFVTLGVWKLLRPADVRTRRWRTFGAAFAAGYLGLLAAAFATAVQFGLQPLLERAPDGTPLFCPFPLRIAVPAMVISHLFVGLLEGVVTGLVIVALAKAPDSIVTESANLLPAAVFWRRRSFWAVAAIAVLLVPVGLWLPDRFGAGDAWGEWAPEEAAKLAGLREPPAGMAHSAAVWPAPVPDYAFHETESMTSAGLQYVAAAILGIAAITLLFMWLGKLQRLRLDRIRHAGEGP